MKPKIRTVILAGGIGSRFKTKKNKLNHRLLGKTILSYVIDVAETISDEVYTVLGAANKGPILEIQKDLNYLVQHKPLGTGHALSVFFEHCRNECSENDLVLVLLGDVPLITSNTLKSFITHSLENEISVSFISTIINDPKGYGRVIRDKNNLLAGIKEDKLLSLSEVNIQEINTGIFLFKVGFLSKYLDKIRPHTEAKDELFITDLVEIAIAGKEPADCHICKNNIEFMGINTLEDLYKARSIIRGNINRKHMLNGVEIIDTNSVFIDINIEIKPDTVIYPNNILKGNTSIGNNVRIGPNNYLENAVIKDNAEIIGNNYIKDTEIGPSSCIGPFAHLRGNNKISEKCRIGNFVEIKKSEIEEGSKASHLSYIGDAVIGRGVNIGAGVITCNYDGITKHTTTIHDNAFIGSDSQLIAPVTIGESSYIASGSTIVADVPAYSLSIARSRQVFKKDWVKDRNK